MSDTTHSIYCAANGCPQLGSMSTGTSGWDHGTQYYCFVHFGCKPGTAHAITAELQRLDWLVKITQGIRAANSKNWDKAEAAMNKEIRLNQSGHLLRGNKESLPKWLARLEDTLRIACTKVPDTQMPLEEPES